MSNLMLENNPNFLIINQAIKDSSLEIKNSIETFQQISIPENKSRINIKVSLDKPKVISIDSEINELELHYLIEGYIDKKHIFIVEVVHSSIIKSDNVNKEQKEFFFNNEYPFSIIPFIYCTAINLLQNAGLSGLSIPPMELINFEHVAILGHHAKDISFQVHCSSEYLANIKQDHKEMQDINVDFNINSKINLIDPKILPIEGPFQAIEVEIGSIIKAKHQNNIICVAEVLYAIVLKINNNLEKETKNRFLSLDCPRLFFPFLISIINKSFMDAGLGKINIPPIDFARLAISQMQNKPKD